MTIANLFDLDERVPNSTVADGRFTHWRRHTAVRASCRGCSLQGPQAHGTILVDWRWRGEGSSEGHSALKGRWVKGSVHGLTSQDLLLITQRQVCPSCWWVPVMARASLSLSISFHPLGVHTRGATDIPSILLTTISKGVPCVGPPTGRLEKCTGWLDISGL